MRAAPNLKNINLIFLLLRNIFIFSAFLLTSIPIFAEKLPLKFYTSADELASDSVTEIVADSRGFLWFCTDEGLSRFDGYSFKSYTQEQGLPHRSVNDFLETKDGDYLVATSGGLAVFDPLGKAFRWNIVNGKLEQTSDEPMMFKTFLTPDSQKDNKVSKSIITLEMDGNGTVYAGTGHGLFRFIKSGNDWRFEKVEFAEWNNPSMIFNSLLLDSRKNLWIATSFAIYLMTSDGIIRKINEFGGNSIFEDQSGKIWADSGGNDIGIRIYAYQGSNSTPDLINTYTKKDGLLKSGFSNALVQNSDGKIFVASGGKTLEFISDAKEEELKFRVIAGESLTVAANKDGAVWFGIYGKGAARYLPDSFSTLTEKDGLPNEIIRGIFGNSQGEVFLTVGKQKLVRVGDEKIETVQIPGLVEKGWAEAPLDLQSQSGEFWISSANGLFRFPKVNDFNDLLKTTPKKVYRKPDGLFSDYVVAVFEDSRGDIWISSAAENSILRWERSTEKIYSYLSEKALPKESSAVSFGEDAAGNIWFGFYFGQIIRYKDGKFRDFTQEGLIPRNSITQFLSDKSGRLWFSTLSRGLFRVDEPNSENPVFENLSTANGLSSNLTNCLAEDKFGRIYVGTGRGINRIEPDTKRIKIFTQNDGLPGNAISKCYADVNGNLWFSSLNSLIKLAPKAETVSSSPPIFIAGISANGKSRPISELGEKEIKNLEFNSEERQIQITFFAISFTAGENLHYQYKLDEQDWSAPNEQRNVDLNLSPGTYNFSVRAITADGVLSENPATITFTIARPIWQRWWFLLSVLISVGAAISTIYYRRLKNLEFINAALNEAKTAEEKLSQSRQERLAELQKVRTRIATDLHDDIGSSLTQISVLSGVARREFLEKKEISTEPLERISAVSNELVEAMSDIVWAINPRKDSLRELIFRMRRFASDVLTASDIEFEFETPEADDKTQLGANIRREIFAIFKECINNIVRHSGAKNVNVVFEMQEAKIYIKIADDGHGFDTEKVLSEDFSPEKGGNGLINMRRRAKDLGGTCEINSSEKGTTTTLKIPLTEAKND